MDSNRPAWLEALIGDYQAGVASTFILYGGVFDYAEGAGNLPVRDYLAGALARFTVARYSPDEGIAFPNDNGRTLDRKRFEEVVGLAEALDPAAALLRGDAPSDEANLPSAPTAALPLLARYLRQAEPDEEGNGKAAVIVDRLDLLCPPAPKETLPDAKLALLSLLHRLGTDPRVDQAGGLCVLLSPTLDEVHADLRAASSGIRAIEVPPPGYEQRLAYVRELVAARGVASDVPEVEFAAKTAGLFRRHIEDIVLRAIASGGPVTRELVRSRGAEQIRAEYAGLLEVIEPTYGFEAIGGHSEAVAYLREAIGGALSNPELASEAPVGIILAGPSGTGKTFVAGALAKEAGVHFVKLGQLRGGIVGQTEAQQRKAFRGIEAMAPCLVFIDEIDQQARRGEGGPDGGGGGAAENALFAGFLEFFSKPEHRGRIVAVGATNYPDRVDAALKRPGRFDVVIPLLPPDSALEREHVLDTLLVRYGYAGESISVMGVAEQTDGWTQAELERLVVQARRLARLRQLPIGDALVSALTTLRPRTREIRRMTLLALAECDDTTLVPERYRNLLGEQAAAEVNTDREQGPERAGRKARAFD